MTDDITVSIDGLKAPASTGERLLDLLMRRGYAIPHVCYNPALGALQTCDSCMVSIDGVLVRACGATVRPAMTIEVRTPGAEAARAEAVQRLLANHELYCTVCDYNNGDCEVHNAADQLGLRTQVYPFTRKGYAVDRSNPFYRYDPDQCILCGRCVEACQNVQVTETLSIDWTMEQPRVLWDGGKPINDSSCVSCGHCVTVCPCNALLEKSMEGHAGHLTSAPHAVLRGAIDLVKFSEKFTGLRPLFATSKAEAIARGQSVKRTKTVCTYCGVGCAFEVWTVGRHILKIQPRKEAPANGISTCVKGKFGWDHINSPERLVQPVIRRGDRWEEAGWDEALAQVAGRLRAIAREHGPDSIGFIASSKTTNEECYLVQKLARAVFGTNNVDNCARYCQSPASKALSRTVGYGADSGTMNDIERASLVLIVGSNTAVSHPVLAARIKRRVKLHGQRLIVSDLRDHDMAKRAHIFLRPAPSTDLVWINAVARHIIDQGWEDREFVGARVNDFEKYQASLERYTLDYAERITGLSAETLREVAREIAHAESVCGLWAMGVTQHAGGTDTCTAISNLLLLTGNFGRPGTGGYPLRGHNNVQGSCDFGALHNYLPGYGHVDQAEARAPFEKAWGVKLPEKPGLNNTTMIDEADAGKLKALYVIGEELSLVDGNAHRVQRALAKLDFLVVQDIFMSNTGKFADVVLPGTPSLEKEGTFVNTERRIQRLHQALEPLGNSRPDWRILCDLAGRLGHEWSYASPSDIMDEIAAIVPAFAGVNYHRLDGWKSLCWPVAADGTDTPLLYTERFHTSDGRAQFFPVDWTPPVHAPDAEFTLHLNNGRVLEHFHEGNLTGRSPGLLSKVAKDYVDLAPVDAERLDLREGDWVKLVSPFGEVRTQVVITGELRAGELYMPVCSSIERVNYLTSSDTDPVVKTPAYKEMSVRIEKLDRAGPSPMPRGNPRFGHPTPQSGVKVAEKWERPDYRSPDQPRPEGAHV
ncbi:MAG TPA: formate dehydrogenase subunit alpha [Opitutus sp.]|nr:formate dehydrogenase subunit alpha [Opitutus sp.]